MNLNWVYINLSGRILSISGGDFSANARISDIPAIAYLFDLLSREGINEPDQSAVAVQITKQSSLTIARRNTFSNVTIPWEKLDAVKIEELAAQIFESSPQKTFSTQENTLSGASAAHENALANMYECEKARTEKSTLAREKNLAPDDADSYKIDLLPRPIPTIFSKDRLPVEIDWTKYPDILERLELHEAECNKRFINI